MPWNEGTLQRNVVLTFGQRKVLTGQVSQAAACDGTLITTSAGSQEIIPGTLPTF